MWLRHRQADSMIEAQAGRQVIWLKHAQADSMIEAHIDTFRMIMQTIWSATAQIWLHMQACSGEMEG